MLHTSPSGYWENEFKPTALVENFQTDYCTIFMNAPAFPGRKAQKILKITEVVDESGINIRKNLADDFLKSGGY